MAEYIALIWKDEDRDYGVSFPDFPGCVTAGSSLLEARQLGAEALQFHVEGLLADGEELPAPTPLDEVMEDREARDAVAALVTVQTGRRRAMRVNVTIRSDFLEQIDKYAEVHHLKRSQLLSRAAMAVVRGDVLLPQDTVVDKDKP